MKIFTTLLAVLLSVSSLHAQDEDKNMFNHMAFGITAGTPGVGLELAMPIGNYVQVRAGATYMPPIPMNTTERIARGMEIGYEKTRIDTKGSSTFINGKLLFDLYPAPSFPLHVTLGAYIGGEKVLKIESTNGEFELKKIYSQNTSNYQVNEYCAYGPLVGSYPLLPNAKGQIDSWIQTSMIRPYAGLGWGKAVSDKSFDWMLEAGVMFWGTPKVYSRTDSYSNIENKMDQDVEIQKLDMEGPDGGLVKMLTKINLYPVINFRIGFNMF